MIKSRKSLVLGMMTALVSVASAASAQDNGLGYAYLFGYGAANTPTIRSFVPAPPYFALHPPVYYGQKYTRPYGESPFAAWPQLRSPAGYYPRPAGNHIQPVVINFAPAHPQAHMAPATQASPDTIYSAPAPALSPAPTPAPHQQPVAPPAPNAPVAKPSPVVIDARPVQPLTIDNPYYQPSDRRFVGKPSIGQ